MSPSYWKYNPLGDENILLNDIRVAQYTRLEYLRVQRITDAHIFVAFNR